MSSKSKLSAMFEAINETASSDTSTTVIPHKQQESSGGIQHIELKRIYVNPNQFRKFFDPDEQEKLKNSIKENGFQGSILLRPLPDALKSKAKSKFDFELIYGESRFRAVKDLGWDTIPAEIKQLTDQQTRRIRLDENLVRKDLNPLEEIDALLEIAADELGISTNAVISLLDEVSNTTNRGKKLSGASALLVEKLEAVLEYYKKGTVAGFRSKLRKLHSLPDDIKKAVEEKLSWSKAIEIAPVKDDAIRKKLLTWAIKENPSRDDIRKRRKELVNAAKHSKQEGANDNSIKLRFYKGLASISKSEEWKNPDNQKRIEQLIQEIEDIFHITIS